jgi:hypothetical protein
MELADVKLGSVGEVKLEALEGKLKVSLAAEVSADQLLVMLENAIPGDVDNKIIDGMRAILAKLGK